MRLSLLVAFCLATPSFAQEKSKKSVAKTVNSAPRPEFQCTEVVTGGEIVHNCIGGFPSQAQLTGKLAGIEALAILHGNFDELTSDKYITSASLKKLSLTKCNIRKIQSNLFTTTPNIETLYLNENQLTVIENGTFNGLSNLILLNLMDNLIGEIKSEAFSSTQKLSSLYLSNNKLTKMPERLPSFLSELDASKNFISKVEIFSLPNAERIDLCDNRIESITSQIVCPALKTLCLSTENLDWDSQYIKSSILKQLVDLTVTGYGENPFPKSLAMLLSQNKTSITKLKLTGYKVRELELPYSLTDLSLTNVTVDEGKNPIKFCPQTLQVLDLTDSPKVASKLISAQPNFFQYEHLKHVNLKDCGVKDLSWLKRNPTYPILNCSLEGSVLDCDNVATLEVLCGSSSETKIAIQGSVTCSSENKPWDGSLCSNGFPDHRTENGVPSDSPGRDSGDSEHLGSEMNKTKIILSIVIPVMILLIILAVVFIILRSRKQKRSNSLVMEEHTSHPIEDTQKC